MAQFPLNDTTQPVDSEEEGRSLTMDKQWLGKKAIDCCLFYACFKGSLHCCETGREIDCRTFQLFLVSRNKKISVTITQTRGLSQKNSRSLNGFRVVLSQF